MWRISKSFLGFYDYGAVEPKVCLELGCTVGGLCLCSECLCCYMCTGECGCLAASRDFDFILQQLLIAQPCFSYKWVNPQLSSEEGFLFHQMIWNFINRGVKLVAAKMVALDDVPSSSSDAVGSASSQDEIFELYDWATLMTLPQAQ